MFATISFQMSTVVLRAASSSLSQPKTPARMDSLKSQKKLYNTEIDELKTSLKIILAIKRFGMVNESSFHFHCNHLNLVIFGIIDSSSTV